MEGFVSYPDGPNDTYAFDTKYGYFSFSGGMEEKDLAAIKYPIKFVSYEDEKKYLELNAPKCKSGEPKAKAKIKIRFFEDTKADSCQEGSWLRDYEIISVGKYSCMK